MPLLQVLRTRQLTLAALLVLTAWQAIACTGASNPAADNDCRPISHVAGTTCVPDEIERVVTLDTVAFEYAIALGLKPVGTVATDRSTYLHSQAKEAENIGQAGEPNLEKVLALKPDLILGLDFHQPIYPQASQIAPTVLLKFEHSGQWKEVFQTFSTVVNREAAREQVMTDYRGRLEEFKRRLTAKASDSGSTPPQVSVVRIYPDSINLYQRDSFPGTILQDAGLPRPPAQTLSAAEAQRTANNPIQTPVSRELLSRADGDVMFLWTGENTTEARQEAEKKLAELKADPLWQKLNAVQQNKVYQVPSYWIGSGPLAANRVMDDLFKYLVEKESG
jgi:iron complex transport system substrate-binding protein